MTEEPHAFAIRVFTAAHVTLKPEARKLWPNSIADREEGVSETVTRAIAKAHLFDGANLIGWLKIIMRNVRRDQWAKGYRKGSKPVAGDRLVYSGHYDYAALRPCLCDPESIMIALERFGVMS